MTAAIDTRVSRDGSRAPRCEALPFAILSDDPADPVASVPCGMSEIVVRRSRSLEELEQAFGLIYHVYVEERCLLSARGLPSEQQQKLQKWDSYDFVPTTQHLVALHEGRVVGTMRLMDGIDGLLPLDNNGFSLAAERAKGHRIREGGKLLIHQAYRGQRVIDAIFWVAWKISRFKDGVSAIHLSCEPNLAALYQRKLSARSVGRFVNREFGKEYVVMRVVLPATFAELTRPRAGGQTQSLEAGDGFGRGETRRIAESVIGRGPLSGLLASRTVVDGGGGAATACINRIEGVARSGGRNVTWSAVIKELSPRNASTDSSDAFFWKREALAYASGVLSDLPSPLSAPRCYHIDEGQAHIRLVLSEVKDIGQPDWIERDFVAAARSLGQFNGTYPARRSPPNDVWVSRRWLRGYLDAAAPGIAQLPNSLSHPLVARAFPSDHAQRVLELWSKRESLLGPFDELPHGFAHLDAVRRNLFRGCDSETAPRLIAIDWAFAGLAPFGQELAALILGSAVMFDLDSSAIATVEQRGLAAYLKGLRDAGWDDDESRVWFAYAAGAALRYSMYAAVRLRVLLDASLHAWAERTLGRPVSDIADRVAAVCDHALRLGIKALRLRSRLRRPRIAGAGNHGPARQYLMEHAGEGDRLEAKTDSAASREQLIRAGLLPGMRALDLGCGTGAVTRIMAEIVADAALPDQNSSDRVVGVDASGDRLEQARRLAANLPGARFVRGEATNLSLDDATFDFAWSRFLFEYLPQPERALAEMVRVVKPGGIVAVADLDGQIAQFFPLPARLDAEMRGAFEELRSIGFDPWVGRKLFAWFHAARLEDIRVHILPYQVYQGGIPSTDWANWTAKLKTAADLLATRTGDAARWNGFRDEMLDHIRRPDVFYYSTLILVTGRKASPSSAAAS